LQGAQCLCTSYWILGREHLAQEIEGSSNLVETMADEDAAGAGADIVGSDPGIVVGTGALFTPDITTLGNCGAGEPIWGGLASGRPEACQTSDARGVLLGSVFDLLVFVKPRGRSEAVELDWGLSDRSVADLRPALVADCSLLPLSLEVLR